MNNWSQTSQEQLFTTGAIGHIVACKFVAMKKRTDETFIENLDRLMAVKGYNPNDVERVSIAKGRKVTSRAVRHILAGERKPSIDTADRIANVFGLSGWQMLMPTLLDSLEEYSKMERLIEDWKNADNGGKDYIEITAKRESSRRAPNEDDELPQANGG